MCLKTIKHSFLLLLIGLLSELSAFGFESNNDPVRFLISLGYHQNIARKIVRSRPDLLKVLSSNVNMTIQNRMAVTVYRGLIIKQGSFDPKYNAFHDFAREGEMFVSALSGHALLYAKSPSGESMRGVLLEMQIPRFLLEYLEDDGATIVADMNRILDISIFLNRVAIIKPGELSKFKFGQQLPTLDWYEFQPNLKL